ncbi:MAG: hypothetical protein P8130_02850 [Deltaproteobacteria bacterium]|jgi:hypothetical protein
MNDGAKESLTLPWLWVAVLMAMLTLMFMLPPFDGPLKSLAKTKIQIQAPDDSKAQANDLVF